MQEGPGEEAQGRLRAGSHRTLAEGPGDLGAGTRGAGTGRGQSGLGATGSQGSAGRGPRGGSDVGPRAAPHPLLLLRRPRRCLRYYLPLPLPAILSLGRRASRLPRRARPATATTACHWPTPPPLFNCCGFVASPIGRDALCLPAYPPQKTPSIAPTKPRHARAASQRRRQLGLVPAVVLPTLSWRCIPTHGPKSARSLAESAVTRVWVRLFGSKWEEGGPGLVCDWLALGRIMLLLAEVCACHHKSRPPPPAYSFTLAKPSATRDRKQGMAGWVNARAPLCPAQGGLRLPRRRNFIDNPAWVQWALILPLGRPLPEIPYLISGVPRLIMGKRIGKRETEALEKALTHETFPWDSPSPISITPPPRSNLRGK